MLLHFIWINKTQTFAEGEYISLLSALKNTSYDVRLHTNLKYDTLKEHNPFDLLKSYPSRFEIIDTPMYDEDLFLETNMLQHINWISDIERVRILKEYGGMYSDLDIIWFKDVPEELIKDEKFVLSWENKSYLIVQDAWMYMEKDWEGADKIWENFLNKIKEIKENKLPTSHKKGIKFRLLFFYIIGEYAKNNNYKILDRKFFFRNNWRRIERACLVQNLPIKNDTKLTSRNQSTLNFKDACGIHWGNSIFYWSSIKELNDMKPIIEKIIKE